LSTLILGAMVRSLHGQEFSLLHVVQTSSGTQPASYPMDTYLYLL
jgi:hypothetical protein